MAFNPFSAFRRHSKVMFAGLTIMCMFVFVLSSGIGGGGDFFDWMARRAGSGRYRTVATLDGTKISDVDLERLRFQRQIASDFISNAVAAAQQGLMAQVQQNLSKFDGDVQQNVRQTLMMRQFALSGQFGDMTDRFRQMLQMQTLPQLNQIIARLDPKAKADQITQLRNLEQVLVRDIDRLNRRADEFYFGGTGRSTDLLDFMIWRKEADRLGIHFTPSDANLLVEAEALNVLDRGTSETIDRNMAQRYGRNYSRELLLSALAEEFRVRAAQTSLTGESSGGTRTVPPTPITPFDFWKFYQENRTSIQVAMLTVEPKSLVGEVAGTPSESELRELFDRFKDTDANPTSPNPGFRIPRKVEVKWVSGRADLPFYRAQAEKKAQLLTAVAQAGFGLGVHDGGLAPAVHLAVPFVLDVPLLAAFERAQLTARQDPWTSWFTRKLNDRSVIGAEALAGLTSQLLAAGGTGAPALTIPVAAVDQAQAAELRARAKSGVIAVFTALTAPPLAALAAPLVQLPPPFELSEIRKLLTVAASEDLAKEQLKADLETLQKEIDKRARGKDRDGIGAYVEQFAKERGLTLGGTAGLCDPYSLANDPGMEPLRTLYAAGHASLNDPTLLGFPRFFYETKPGVPLSAGLYVPRWYPNNQAPSVPSLQADQPVYLTWRSADVEGRVPTFDEARPAVEAAWKLQKARELAVKKAEAIAVEAGKLKGDLQQLRDLAAKHKVDLFELGPMARLNPRVEMQFTGAPRAYEPYQIPPTKIAFPGPDLVNQILGLKDKPLGETVVLHDAPKAHYYVTSLVMKDEVTPAEFHLTFLSSAPGAVAPDSLLSMYMSIRRDEFQQKLREQLRATYRLKPNAEVLAKLDRRESAEE